MHETHGMAGRQFNIKLSNQWATASLLSIKHKVNINTLSHEPTKDLHLNDIAVCNIGLNRTLPFESFKTSKELGSFILVDRHSHATVAAGMIEHSLRRADNLHSQAMSVTRADREKLNGHPDRKSVV